MSVVAVRVNKDKIEFAADSISVRGDTKRDNSVKLFEINQMIIGEVGYARETSLLSIFAKTHSPLDNTEKAIVDFFFEFGKWKQGLNLGFNSDNIYIFGYKGKAFYVNDLHVREINDYDAIGAGMDYALAALYHKHSAKEAVKAACELSCYVSEPIITLSMEASHEQV